MYIVYTGSLPRPAVPQLRGLEIERGVPVEVPDEIGVQLLEQRVWQPAGVIEIPQQEGELPPFSEWTVDGLKQLADEWGLQVPSSARKTEIVELVEAEAKRRAAIDAPPIENDEDQE